MYGGRDSSDGSNEWYWSDVVDGVNVVRGLWHFKVLEKTL